MTLCARCSPSASRRTTAHRLGATTAKNDPISTVPPWRRSRQQRRAGRAAAQWIVAQKKGASPRPTRTWRARSTCASSPPRLQCCTRTSCSSCLSSSSIAAQPALGRRARRGALCAPRHPCAPALRGRRVDRGLAAARTGAAAFVSRGVVVVAAVIVVAVIVVVVGSEPSRRRARGDHGGGAAGDDVWCTGDNVEDLRPHFDALRAFRALLCTSTTKACRAYGRGALWSRALRAPHRDRHRSDPRCPSTLGGVAPSHPPRAIGARAATDA